jgi:hypothetical protein
MLKRVSLHRIDMVLSRVPESWGPETPACWFSETRVAEPGAAENVLRRVGPGSDRRSPGTAPVGPATRLTPLRPFSYTSEHENHGSR